MSIAALAIGFAFGFVLQRSGLSRYDRIANVFRLRDLAVIQFLLTALVTAAIGTAIVRVLTGVSVPVPATYAMGNLLGGIVFGIGMALAGFCPGTIAAGAGEGRLDSLVPGALGLVGGAVVYGLVYPHVMPSLARFAHETTLPALLDVRSAIVVAILAELLVGGLHLLHVVGTKKAFTGHGGP